MNNPEHIYESLKTFFGVKVLKFFDVDPESGKNIPDPQYFTLLISLPLLLSMERVGSSLIRNF
jgi:hypothetical protein